MFGWMDFQVWRRDIAALLQQEHCHICHFDTQRIGDTMHCKLVIVFGVGDQQINLVFVDPNTDDYFSSRRPSQYTTDGLHPDSAAAEKLAEMIWAEMQTNNIEQGADCSTFSGGDNGGCN